MQVRARERAFELWRGGNQQKAVTLAIKFQFRVRPSQDQLESKFNVVQQLVATDKIDLLLRYIKDDAALAKEAVYRCTTHKHLKVAGKIIQTSHFDPAEFPEVISRMKQSSMRYFLNSKDVLLPELIEMVEDDLECIAFIVEDLDYKSNHQTGNKRRIAWMGELAATLFHKYPAIVPYLRPNVAKKLSRMRPPKPTTQLDFFGPQGEGCLVLEVPQDSVMMIDTPEKLAGIEWSYPIYGLDCEWRMNVTKFDFNPVSILTIACEAVKDT